MPRGQLTTMEPSFQQSNPGSTILSISRKGLLNTQAAIYSIPEQCTARLCGGWGYARVQRSQFLIINDLCHLSFIVNVIMLKMLVIMLDYAQVKFESYYAQNYAGIMCQALTSTCICI